jgi:hypothetical protein
MIPMTFIEFIYSIILTLVIFLCILSLFYIGYKTIKSNKKPLQELSFEELFEIVNIIINNEISLYERNIFNNGGRILTKASYDNYYKDILQNVYNSLADELVNNITVYIDRDSFYTMISREIQIYLNAKIME